MTKKTNRLKCNTAVQNTLTSRMEVIWSSNRRRLPGSKAR